MSLRALLDTITTELTPSLRNLQLGQLHHVDHDSALSQDMTFASIARRRAIAQRTDAIGAH
jgi:hypothetical protein